MDDFFGDPNLIDDVNSSLSSDSNDTSSIESEGQSGFSWKDYCDIDYNEVEKELHVKYGNLPEFYEADNKDDIISNSDSDSQKANPRDGAKFLFTPLTFIANLAATQLTALKNFFVTRPQPENEFISELDGPDSQKKIMTSLTREIQPASEKQFTNQDDILEEVGSSPNEEGICSPMVNLYFEEQLGYRDRTYREGSAQHIYQEAIKEKQHQIELIHQGKDGEHAVFIDHNIPYKKKTVKASKSEREEEVEDLLKDYDRMLITYPVIKEDGEKDRHQIYVEKIERSHCSRFDVNKQGGVDEMPCNLFYHKLASKIAKAHDQNDEAEVIVAGIKRSM